MRHVAYKWLSIAMLACTAFFFDTTAAQAQEAGFISGVAAASGTFLGTGYDASRMVNDSDITEGADGLGSRNAVHGNTNSGYRHWRSTATGAAQVVWFNLGADRQLRDMLVWNCNQLGYSDWGVQRVLISVYTNDGWNASPRVALHQEVTTFTKALENTTQPYTDRVDLSGLTAQWVRLDIQTNYGGAGSGISEIRFYEELDQDARHDVTATATSDSGGTFAPANMVNNTGMIEGASGLRSRDASSDATGSTAVWTAAPGLPQTTTFTLVKDTPLTDVLVWNTNALNEGTRAVKTVNVRYKREADSAFTLMAGSPFTFTQANNDGTSSTYNDLLDFTGITAQVVSFEITDDYDANRPSLAEVRFYGKYHPGYIRGVEVMSTFDRQRHSQGTDAEYIVNDSGMEFSDTGIGDPSELHESAGGTFWLSAPGAPANQELIFDLGSAEYLDEMYLWNCNSVSEAARSLQDAVIRYKLNKADDWTEWGSHTFQQSSSYTAGVSTPYTDVVDLGGIQARYVQLDIQSNYGDANYTKINEVRFYRTLAPDAPDGVTTSGLSATGVTWQWNDNATNESAYHVFFGPGATAPATSVTLAADTVSYPVSGLTPNSQYAFQVAASNALGVSDKTTNTTVWTYAAVPNAPAVSNQISNSFDVAIGADTNPAGTEYAIQFTSGTLTQWVQGDGSLAGSEVWQTASAWGTVTIGSLDEGLTYEVAAKARNALLIETALSEVTSASTGADLPSTPQDVTAVGLLPTSMTLGWTAVGSNVDGFKVYFGQGATAPSLPVTTLPASTTEYTSSGLSANTLYAFRVAATNSSGDSAKTATYTTYTLAAQPAQPIVANVDYGTLSFEVSLGTDQNPAFTEYAIQVSDGVDNWWLQADGSLAATVLWQTAAQWGTLQVGVPSAGVYGITAIARNAAFVETSPSAAAAAHVMPPAKSGGWWSLY